MAEFDEKIHDDIDRYLQGKMDAQERAQFDQAIAGDPLLKEEVNFQRTLINAVKHARKQELKEYIRANAGAEATGSGAGAGSGMKLLRLAAAFLLAGGAAFFIYTQTKTETDKDQVAYEEGPHGAGELAQMPPQQSDSAANQSVTDSDRQFSHALANNGNAKAKNEGPALGVTRETEQEAPQAGTIPQPSEPREDDRVAYKDKEDDAKKPLAGSSQTVFVDKVYDTPQQAASTDLGKKMQMRIDFHPSADLTGYRIYPDHIELYGMQKSDAEILQLTDSLFLKIGKNIYMVSDRMGAHEQGDTDIKPFIKVTDKKLLRRLDQ
jgi:hypothetical protein